MTDNNLDPYWADNEHCLREIERLESDNYRLRAEIERLHEAKQHCHVCGDQTQLACSDCAISFGAM